MTEADICELLISAANKASPPEHLSEPEERGELGAQALELEEQRGGVVRLLGVRADERVAGAFDPSQLHRRQREPIELPADFRLQHRRQLAPIAGSQRLEPLTAIAAKRIVIPGLEPEFGAGRVCG